MSAPISHEYAAELLDRGYCVEHVAQLCDMTVESLRESTRDRNPPAPKPYVLVPAKLLEEAAEMIQELNRYADSDGAPGERDCREMADKLRGAL